MYTSSGDDVGERENRQNAKAHTFTIAQRQEVYLAWCGVFVVLDVAFVGVVHCFRSCWVLSEERAFSFAESRRAPLNWFPACKVRAPWVIREQQRRRHGREPHCFVVSTSRCPNKPYHWPFSALANCQWSALVSIGSLTSGNRPGLLACWIGQQRTCQRYCISDPVEQIEGYEIKRCCRTRSTTERYRTP